MNLPNRITLVRIFMIPIIIFLFLYEFPYSYLIAAIIFGLTACTDFIDGYLARKLNMVTNLGKFLDPIADKVLVVVGLILIVEKQILPLPYGSIACIIIISRELIVGALRQIAATTNVVLAADWWGKIKTVMQDFAIPFLFISVKENNIVYNPIFYYIGFTLFTISLALTIYSGVNYIIKNKKVFINSK